MRPGPRAGPGETSRHHRSSAPPSPLRLEELLRSLCTPLERHVIKDLDRRRPLGSVRSRSGDASTRAAQPRPGRRSPGRRHAQFRRRGGWPRPLASADLRSRLGLSATRRRSRLMPHCKCGIIGTAAGGSRSIPQADDLARGFVLSPRAVEAFDFAVKLAAKHAPSQFALH